MASTGPLICRCDSRRCNLLASSEPGERALQPGERHGEFEHTAEVESTRWDAALVRPDGNPWALLLGHGLEVSLGRARDDGRVCGQFEVRRRLILLDAGRAPSGTR